MNRVEVQDFAWKIRKLALDMALKASPQASHIGGSLSCVEIMAALYGYAAHYRVEEPLWDERDRIIISKAHCTLAQLPALCLLGYFPESELFSAYTNDGILFARPYKPEYGLEFSGGSLGMGICLAVGMAITAQQEGKRHKVYTLIGDGESNEGAVWESFMTANKYHLDNLTVIIDRNRLQYDGTTEDVMPLEPLGDKLRSFGFSVEEIDGHDLVALCDAFDADSCGKPKAIIAHTIKARGIARLEDKAESHHTSITQEDYDAAIAWMEARKNASI